MNESTTISWILLSAEMASSDGYVDHNSISMIADGINHAIPTHHEMQKSLIWLMHNGLIDKKSKGKYMLTDSGRAIIEAAQIQSNIVLKIWDEVDDQIKMIMKTNES